MARYFWSFGYDSTADTITLGPCSIDVSTADRVAAELAHAIYVASREDGK
ncbi:hypothetical protein QMK19_31455 [Streptomyces sp. H10-C2]|nr:MULTISPECIES: hypothetical protein [unclassified Streptomyces]MDJ0346086.1 hypothetical protein [Streptomyces sp. PH10-H1]MDJ0374037.1 hypothetical protein [Streptomyces sp. H10-C2]